MKKLLTWTIAAALLVSVMTLPGYGQTAQDVLKKMIQAQGGAKYLETIKDSTTSGGMEINQMGQSLSATFTWYHKEPNKFRRDIEVMGMNIIQAYDGQKAWGTNMQTFQVEEFLDDQAKSMARQAVGYGSLLDPAKFGIVYTMKPKAKLDNKEYIVLEQKAADGHPTTMYIDPDTYLTYKIEATGPGQMGADVKTETYPGDYKKIGPGMVAHSMRILQDGVETVKLTIEKVAFNTNLEDSIFVMSK
jgi:outer membrane lipoprotein-sorting protein